MSNSIQNSIQTEPALGATYLGNGRCHFVVWAPFSERVELHLVSPRDQLVPMDAVDRGYHSVTVYAEPGTQYTFVLNGCKERPDPASKSQPGGVHGPSEVTRPDFRWTDEAWAGIPLEKYIFYELHVGVFSAKGTFDAAIPHLDDLVALGVTAVEIMPVAQFPGDRNWGYDGVHPYAVQDSYGGPSGLKRLVDACHQREIAVVLDVVYNHLGPEGNYLWDYGPYFTDRYRTPWGSAVNFDGPHSDEVRHFFIENALYWITEFHVDALRLDAVHAIFDRSAHPFLAELAEAVRYRGEQLGRRTYTIAESDLNDVRLIQPADRGGYGLDAQWSDDFHHALHVLLTGERTGYYEDFGKVAQLAAAFRDGYVYKGQYSPFRQRRHGNPPDTASGRQFVVCSRNHDQVGNRMLGERPSQLVGFEGQKLAAGVILLSPFLPLLFMGEEYGETAPFQYFVSHTDPQLVDAVRRGRKEEFAAFAWQGETPDPQDEATFLRAKLQWNLRTRGKHGILLDYYRELIELRKSVPALAALSKQNMEVRADEAKRLLFARRWHDEDEVLLVFNLGQTDVSTGLPVPAGHWQRVIDSADEHWGGPGSTVPGRVDSEGVAVLSLRPESVILLRRAARS